MAGGDYDDTTQDPLLFKNVPRRPRSAASRPRKDEPDGGEPGGISSVSNNNVSPPAMTTSVASNKRPASSTVGGGGAAEHVPRANKKHRLVVPIDEPEPNKANERDVGILGGTPPALLSHKDKAAAAAAAAASSSASSSEAEPAVDWAENERCRKGKTPVVTGACAAVARGPLAGKLLRDAIRYHESTAVAGTSFKSPSRTAAMMEPKKARTRPKKPAKKKDRAKPKKEKDRGAWFWCGTGRDGMSSAGSAADHSFDRIGVVSDRLRTTLRELGVAAPAPVRLYGRFLTRCDRDIQQTRLLMSCKRWRADGAEFPLCAFLTEEERGKAHGEGLPITAYDRGGDAYELTFRFLECNVAYRLIYKWGDFLRHNGLVVAKDEPAPVDDDVMLDLWMFRPPGPGGKVGMVMLHYRRGDAAHADAALDEVGQKRQQLMLNNGDAAAADAVMEDVVGDANQDAGVIGEMAATAPAPSSPSEPSGGGAAIEAVEASSSPSEADGVGAKVTEEQAGASGEVADAPSTSSSELHGGGGRSDEVTAPFLLGGGDGTEDEEQEAGGALMVMVLEVEAATRSSLDSNAGGAANEVAAPPSSAEAGEDDEVVEAAARSWNLTKYEFKAAQGLMMLSRDNSSS